MTAQNLTAIINAIVTSYLEPYEIAIATDKSVTREMLSLCVRDNWLYGAQAIVPRFWSYTDDIIDAANLRNVDMIAVLLINYHDPASNAHRAIYALAANNILWLFSCRLWSWSNSKIWLAAMNGAIDTNNTVLMQKLYARKPISFTPTTMTVIHFGHREALQLLLTWGASHDNAVRHAVDQNDTDCLQIIHDHAVIIDYNGFFQYAIRHNRIRAALFIKKRYNVDLQSAFTMAVCGNNHTMMRMIHNWGGSHNNATTTLPYTIELIRLLKIGNANF